MGRDGTVTIIYFSAGTTVGVSMVARDPDPSNPTAGMWRFKE